jgi:subtilisin family serine protease
MIDKNKADSAGPAKGSEKPASTPTAGAGDVQARPRLYLIAPRVIGQFQPMSTDQLADALADMPGVTIRDRIKPRGFGVLSAGGPASGVGEILVAEMSLERGEALRANAPANVIVEHNELLRHAASAPVLELLEANAAAGGGAQVSVDVQLKVVDKNGKGVPKASVTVYGQAFPARGQTDASGALTVTVSGGTINSIRGIYVKPAANFWDKVIMRPQLAEGEVATIALRGLSETFEGFPRTGMVGWGQRMMGLDQLGIEPAARGAGVKIGIIDSGCDNKHPQLRHVANGADLVTDDGGEGWTNDEMSHGTHCAGIIGARSDVQAGIAGFAPAAEIHAFKVFPGGRSSDLIEALDLAIERQIDVLNLSLGSDQPSELIAQKIAAAVESGIVCVVAAGNSSGPVQFPGSLPQSITISAIGQTGQYPDDSYHATTVSPAGVGANGVFSAKFSCFGPEVRVSGPGVAIVSTVPGGGYASWDGTSMATPHVTGMVALLLAHHPELRGRPRQGRVAALWAILQRSATPVIPDPLRGGAGIPSVAAALAGIGARTAGSVVAPVRDQVPPAQPPSAPQQPGWWPGRAPPPGNVGYGFDPRLQQLYAYQAYQAYQAAMMQRYLELRAAGLI